MSDQFTHAKTCSKCGFVGVHSLFISGKTICKTCNNRERRNRYATMSDSAKADLLRRNLAWREANREKTRAQKREYGQKNKARDAANQKAWREANGEKLAAAKQAYHRANAETARAKARAWKKANRKRANFSNSRRRARLRGAPGWSYTTMQHVEWRWQMWGGRCWVCGAKAEATDHVIPINDGGPHWPANLRPICKSCNSGRKKKWQPLR